MAEATPPSGPKQQNYESPDMFADDGEMEVEESTPDLETTQDDEPMSPSLIQDSDHQEQLAETKCHWRGLPFDALNNNLQLKPIVPSQHGAHPHVVCVKVGEYKPGSVPLPHPKSSGHARSVWDDSHVRMPFSIKSEYPHGRNQVLKRWDMIHETLRYPIEKIDDFVKCICRFNYRCAWDFSGLYQFFEDKVSEEEEVIYFRQLFPEMASIVRRSPDLITSPLPLLKRGKNGSITLSQQQISSLLANAFFCTFPRRNIRPGRYDHEYSNYPDINFNRLFREFYKSYQPEKLKCLFNYFRRVLLDSPPQGLVTYTRRSMSREEFPNWAELHDVYLTDLHVSSQGMIEEANGMLQADFANSFVGGGVLGEGCVQEEIRFITCPELILSRLFIERLADNEVMFVTGFECFSKYTGYGQTFEFAGSYKDETEVVETVTGPRRKSYLVAMDAIHFNNPLEQYSKPNIDRELNKAFVAFKPFLERDEEKPVCVATGNWGCGAFRGDPELKSLIQLMAAAVSKRNVAYFTFGDERLRDRMFEVFSSLREKKISVGNLYSAILCYDKIVRNRGHSNSLFDILIQHFEGELLMQDSEDLNSSDALKANDDSDATNHVAGICRNKRKLSSSEAVQQGVSENKLSISDSKVEADISREEKVPTPPASVMSPPRSPWGQSKATGSNPEELSSDETSLFQPDEFPPLGSGLKKMEIAATEKKKVEQEKLDREKTEAPMKNREQQQETKKSGNQQKTSHCKKASSETSRQTSMKEYFPTK